MNTYRKSSSNNNNNFKANYETYFNISNIEHLNRSTTSSDDKVLFNLLNDTTASNNGLNSHQINNEKDFIYEDYDDINILKENIKQSIQFQQEIDVINKDLLKEKEDVQDFKMKMIMMNSKIKFHTLELNLDNYDDNPIIFNQTIAEHKE
ncbi:hypothetical protein CYY_005200 [Polysphondylium violaceum]|uniref:Uncharacterized protein n=1 Tax=Polysphondylium violaceum TaxID=133409 RepID=A0A8J4PU57_9MYCE|nr:hypothetical protein CYY_005200 [Polysphondylium violaceum]